MGSSYRLSYVRPLHFVKSGETNRVPAEWLILSVWALLGLVLYRAGTHGRKTIGAIDRRRLVLSDIEDDA